MKLSRNTCWGLYSLAVSPGKSNRVASVLQHLEALKILAALPPTYTWHRIQEVLDTVRHGGAPPSDLLPLLLTAITRELEPVDASSGVDSEEASKIHQHAVGLFDDSAI